MECSVVVQHNMIGKFCNCLCFGSISAFVYYYFLWYKKERIYKLSSFRFLFFYLNICNTHAVCGFSVLIFILLTFMQMDMAVVLKKDWKPICPIKCTDAPTKLYEVLYSIGIAVWWQLFVAFQSRKTYLKNKWKCWHLTEITPLPSYSVFVETLS